MDIKFSCFSNQILIKGKGINTSKHITVIKLKHVCNNFVLYFVNILKISQEHLNLTSDLGGDKLSKTVQKHLNSPREGDVL